MPATDHSEDSNVLCTHKTKIIPRYDPSADKRQADAEVDIKKIRTVGNK